MKKTVSLVMVMIMLLSFGTGAFADAYNNVKRGHIIATNVEEMYVDDGEGNQVKVTITENIYSESTNEFEDNNGGEISPMGMYPDYPVGTMRTYTVDISNEVMGLPSIIGGGISLAAKQKAAQAAAAAISAKVGSNFIPGLNVVSYILGVAAWANATTGSSGISITVDLIYARVYYNKGGYYVYGWDIDHVGIARY